MTISRIAQYTQAGKIEYWYETKTGDHSWFPVRLAYASEIRRFLWNRSWT